MNHYTISPLRMEHIPAITEIHLKAFPDRAMSLLGRGAVARYYQTILNHNRFCLSIGVFDQGQLIGYLFGGEMGAVMNNYLRNNAVYLCTAILLRPWLIMKPIVRKNVGLAGSVLKRMVNRPRKPNQPSGGRRNLFTVLAVAVDPTVQHKGAGKMLMAYAEQVSREKGYTRMNLSVDPSNTSAIKFYERLDWVKDQSAVPWNGYMDKYLTQIESGQQEAAAGPTTQP